MLEITSIEDCSFQRGGPTVVALGFFDGVHLAHQRLIEECKNRAKARHCLSVVFTFQNHPSSILQPEQPTPLLTPYPLKRQILESMQIDALCAVPFDESLCHTPAEEFIRDVLAKRLCAREVAAGFNFRFGYKRKGSPQMLKQYVPSLFDAVDVLEQQFQDEIPISSSRIREALAEGNLLETANLLGRSYAIAGLVVPGDGRGKTIGVPTANIQSEEQILPPNGVYGVRVRLESLNAAPLWGVMNIGQIPTFTDRARRTVEVHLLDYQGDLYGRYLIVEVMRFLRPERKFSGAPELIQQIQTDIQTFRSSHFVQD